MEGVGLKAVTLVSEILKTEIQTVKYAFLERWRGWALVTLVSETIKAGNKACLCNSILMLVETNELTNLPAWLPGQYFQYPQRGRVKGVNDCESPTSTPGFEFCSMRDSLAAYYCTWNFYNCLSALLLRKQWHEGQVKKGVSRKEYFAGSQKRNSSEPVLPVSTCQGIFWDDLSTYGLIRSEDVSN